MPVWVKLNLHIVIWSKEGLEYITSILGEALNADEPTSHWRILGYD